MSRWLLATLMVLTGCGKKSPPTPAAAPEAATAEPAAWDPNAPLAERVALAIDKLQSSEPDDLALAVEILKHSVGEDPGGPTELNLGIALQKQGAFAEAATHYRAVIETHPEWPEPWVYLGSCQERLEDPEGAIATYRDAVAQDTENMGARVALIAVLRSLGRPDDAIEEAKAALKVNANSLPVYNNFALAYLDKGDTTLARFILQKALQSIEGAVNNAYLHTNLGWSHYVDGNKPAATQSLLEAVKLDPNLVPALVYLATVYLEDRNYTDMVPLLETARDQDPENPNVHLNLGIAYRGLGQFDDAKQAYATAQELAPEDPEPWFNLGILLGDSLKDYVASVEAFEKYLAAGGTEVERAQTYIAAVNKERETAERRARAEKARKEREAERKRKEQLLKEAEAAAAAAGDGVAEQPPEEGGEVVEGDVATPQEEPVQEAPPPPDEESREGEAPDAPPEEP